MSTSALKLVGSSKAVMAFTLATVLTCGTLWLAGQDPQNAQEAVEGARLAKGLDDASIGSLALAGDAKQARLIPEGGRQSDAQRIARLQRSIEADRKELDALARIGHDPDGEYRAAEAEFKEIDAQWSAWRKQIEDLRRANKVEDSDRLLAESQPMQAQWQAAKDRFDLAIEERKTLREKATALEKKIEQEVDALFELVGGEDFGTPQVAVANREPAGPAESASPPAAAPTAAPTGEPSTAAPQPAMPSPAAPVLSPLGSISPLLPPAHPPAKAVDAAPSPKAKRAVELARREAEMRKTAAVEAEKHADSINERFEGLRRNIALEQQLLDLARTKADQAQSARAALDKELQTTLTENPAGLVGVWEKITDADKRYADARDEVRRIQDRLDHLRGELATLQDEQIAALRNVKQLTDEADAAQWRLDRLQNPFTPTNIIQWFLDHGPKLLTILICTLILSLLVKLSTRQIAQVVARSGSRGTARDRENRAITLVGVFRNTASIALVAGGLLMALDEVGIPIAPLMGGAAVLGLAIAFGAQNLIRDYFSGFMVLLEDQYGINDVVKIGDVSGSVEKITLRMTVLRDLEGSVHFIPHGSITRVTNMTHGWSRAVVEIGVAYKEDPDRVMKVLIDVAKDLRKDPTYGPLILDGPEMLGLDNLSDSAVVFKFFLKTQPLQRWFVRRELLRRIKNTFDELGIEIPFPQRTLHFRRDDAEALLGSHASDAPRVES
jgi:small conductance mechanosensitive channel